MIPLVLGAAAKAAQGFEANVLGQLFAPMFDTLDSNGGAFGGGAGETAWRPMLTEAIGKAAAAHGGIGLAAPVLKQMLAAQEAASK